MIFELKWVCDSWVQSKYLVWYCLPCVSFALNRDYVNFDLLLTLKQFGPVGIHYTEGVHVPCRKEHKYNLLDFDKCVRIGYIKNLGYIIKSIKKIKFVFVYIYIYICPHIYRTQE